MRYKVGDRVVVYRPATKYHPAISLIGDIIKDYDNIDVYGLKVTKWGMPKGRNFNPNYRFLTVSGIFITGRAR